MGAALAITAAALVPARADTLVFDRCMKACDSADLHAITSARRALVRHGTSTKVVAAPDDVLARLGTGVPLSATQSNITAATLTTQLKAGLELLAQSKNEEAADALGKVLVVLGQNAGLVVSDPTLRELVAKARVSRGIAFVRMYNALLSANDKNRAPRAHVDPKLIEQATHVHEQAFDALADFVRTTAATSIADRWGPEAGDAFDGERKKLLAEGSGELLVQVDDGSVLYYVDVTGEPRHGTFATKRFAGPVQIIALDALGRSRVYDLTIRPGIKTALDIHWARDAQFAVVTSMMSDQPRIGFNYVAESERVHEPEYIRYFGSRASAREIVVIGPVRDHGRQELEGTVYDAGSGVLLRTKRVPMPDETNGSADALATSLFSSEDAQPTKRDDATNADSGSVAVARKLSPWHALGWGVGIGGLATIPFSLRSDATNRTTGLVVGAAGAAIGIITTILYFRQSTRRPAEVSFVPTRGGMTASVGWEF